MRRLLVPLLLLAAVFPAAGLSASAAPDDGSLSVRDGRGKVTLVVKGSLIGRYGNGSITIEELTNDADTDPVVRGYRTFRWGKGGTRTYTGKNVRFRLIGGHYRVQFTGTRKLHFSLVGRGRAQLDGNGSVLDGIFYDGFYSLNGSEEESLPDEPTWFNLATPPPPPPPSN